MATIVGAKRQHQHLTPRDREVLLLVMRGLSNPQIGRVLGISPQSVKNRLSGLLAVRHAQNRVDLIVGLLADGTLDLDDYRPTALAAGADVGEAA